MNPADTGEGKGTAAEASVPCLGPDSWAAGEHPPDCHASGELS